MGIKVKGISLIILVITIIIMIIIAGSIIISLTNSNIINRTKEAIEKSNLKSIREAATLAYSDYQLEGETGNISEYIKNWLISNKHLTEEATRKYVFDQSGSVLSRKDLQEVEISGENISQNGTYDDSTFLKIHGKSEQEGIPTPDNPIKIKSVENFDLVSVGKNLFDISRINEYAINEYWGFKNEILNETDFEVYTPLAGSEGWGYNIELKPNTTYTASAMILQKGQVIGKEETRGVAFNISTTYNTWGRRVFMHELNRLYSTTFTTEPNETKVFISFNNDGMGVAGINRLDYKKTFVKPAIVSKARIVEGNEPLVSYQEHKQKTVSFSHTLRSLPDGTKDYIEIDNVNKTTKIIQNIGYMEFTGNEDWFFNTSEDKVFNDVYVYHLVDNNVSAREGASSHFNSTNDNNNSVHIRYGMGYHFIYIEKSRAADLSKFKAWLTAQHSAGTPVTVQYKLKTPIIIDLDYKEIKTHYPYTNIYTNSIVRPTLQARMVISN